MRSARSALCCFLRARSSARATRAASRSARVIARLISRRTDRIGAEASDSDSDSDSESIDESIDSPSESVAPCSAAVAAAASRAVAKRTKPVGTGPASSTNFVLCTSPCGMNRCASFLALKSRGRFLTYRLRGADDASSAFLDAAASAPGSRLASKRSTEDVTFVTPLFFFFRSFGVVPGRPRFVTFSVAFSVAFSAASAKSSGTFHRGLVDSGLARSALVAPRASDVPATRLSVASPASPDEDTTEAFPASRSPTSSSSPLSSPSPLDPPKLQNLATPPRARSWPPDPWRPAPLAGTSPPASHRRATVPAARRNDIEVAERARASVSGPEADRANRTAMASWPRSRCADKNESSRSHVLRSRRRSAVGANAAGFRSLEKPEGTHVPYAHSVTQ